MTAAPPISALSALIESTSPSSAHYPAHLHLLALQVMHNLQHHHDWTQLMIHTHFPLDPSRALARPLVVGLPPQPVYVHPDEPIGSEKAREGRQGNGSMGAAAQPEWVLPTQLREKWTLRRLADLFDAIGPMPPMPPPDQHAQDGTGMNELTMSSNSHARPTAGLKRMLLASVSDDSTVVYYIVHDGIVKPRQN